MSTGVLDVEITEISKKYQVRRLSRDFTVSAAPGINRGLDASRNPCCMSMTTKAYLCMR